MTNLEKIKEEFKKFRNWGFNGRESAEKAVSEVLGNGITPHIYLDCFDDASHMFLDNQVLFFHDGEIYTKL